jgi:hypothetical protein
LPDGALIPASLILVKLPAGEDAYQLVVEIIGWIGKRAR